MFKKALPMFTAIAVSIASLAPVNVMAEAVMDIDNQY